jgi:hypothetical protein
MVEMVDASVGGKNRDALLKPKAHPVLCYMFKRPCDQFDVRSSANCAYVRQSRKTDNAGEVNRPTHQVLREQILAPSNTCSQFSGLVSYTDQLKYEERDTISVVY